MQGCAQLEQGGLDHFDLVTSRVLRKGISGTHVEVVTAHAREGHDHDGHHGHHHHDHDGHDHHVHVHDHDHDSHDHTHDHEAPFRNLPAIEALLDARVKVARLGDAVTNAAPEYEDCKRLAEKHGVPLKAVYDEAKMRACPGALRLTRQ
jgi:uncharacterized protein (DUF111 family)